MATAIIPEILTGFLVELDAGDAVPSRRPARRNGTVKSSHGASPEAALVRGLATRNSLMGACPAASPFTHGRSRPFLPRSNAEAANCYHCGSRPRSRHILIDPWLSADWTDHLL